MDVRGMQWGVTQHVPAAGGVVRAILPPPSCSWHRLSEVQRVACINLTDAATIWWRLIPRVDVQAAGRGFRLSLFSWVLWYAT